MPYAQSQQHIPEKKRIIYEPWQLKEFDKEIQVYMIKKILSTGEKVRFFDEVKFLKDQGGLSEDGAVIVKDGGTTLDGRTIYDTSKYRDICDKIEQWKGWRYGIEQGRRAGDLQLDKLASSMKI